MHSSYLYAVSLMLQKPRFSRVLKLMPKRKKPILPPLPPLNELKERSPSPTPAPKTSTAIPEVWTQEILRNYDFTGWRWDDLPRQVIKCARSAGVHTNRIIGKVECTECKRQIWTCDPRENLCEEDEYFLFMRNVDLKQQRARRLDRKPVNPFVEQENSEPIFWKRKDMF